MPALFSGLRSKSLSRRRRPRPLAVGGLAAVLAAILAGAAPASPAGGRAAAAPPGAMTSRIKPSDLAQLDAYLAAQKACRVRGRSALLMREDERATNWTVTYGCV